MAQTMLYLAQPPARPFLGELSDEDIPTKTYIKPYNPHTITKVSVGSMVYYTVAICLAILLGFEMGFVGRLLGF